MLKRTHRLLKSLKVNYCPLVVGMLLFFSINTAFANSFGAQKILYFDGVDNYVNIDGLTGDITANQVSIEVRFKTKVAPVGSDVSQIVVLQGVNDNDLLGIGIGAKGSISIKTSANTIFKGTGYNDNRWHLLSVVAIGNVVYAFVDGINSFEYNTGVDLSLMTRFSIGQEYNQSSTSNQFNGKISEVRIWNKGITIESIDDHQCSSLSGSESDLIAAYNFEKSAGGVILSDDSPNSHAGTIENVSTSVDWKLDEVICDNSIDGLIQFSIIGDTPYDLSGLTEKLETLTAHIEENNANSYGEFLIHVGDIKKGATPCDISYYSNAKDVLNMSTQVPYLLIGDNEWSDCSDHSTALSMWNSHFTAINDQFKDSLHVNIQAVRTENISFVKNSVLFITINQVGGRVHDENEWIKRQSDNGDWIVENMTKYKSLARACVIYAHAQPDYKIGIVGENALYQPLLTSADSFKKPVLYIQGDLHTYNKTTNYGGKSNLTKVVIDMDERTNDILQVVVSKNTSDPFFLDKRPFQPAIEGAPTLTEIDSTTVSISWKTDMAVASVVRYGKTDGPLVYTAEDLAPKTTHQITIPHLTFGTTFRFEAGTRTARLANTLLTFEVVTSVDDIVVKGDIKLNQLPDDIHHIEVVDLLGRVVISQPYQQSLDMGGLQKGVYILKLFSSANTSVWQQQLIVKQ